MHPGNATATETSIEDGHVQLEPGYESDYAEVIRVGRQRVGQVKQRDVLQHEAAAKASGDPGGWLSCHHGEEAMATFYRRNDAVEKVSGGHHVVEMVNDVHHEETASDLLDILGMGNVSAHLHNHEAQILEKVNVADDEAGTNHALEDHAAGEVATWTWNEVERDVLEVMQIS